MEAKVIVTYVVCDDTIKALKIKEDLQVKMSMAEVMTTGIVSALLYGGNLENARKYLKETGCILNMLDKSQLNRRLCKIKRETCKKIELDLPKNSSIYADKAYVDYRYEDRLIQEKQIHLLPIRKKNSKCKGGGFLAKIRRRKSKMIETAFSCIEKLMPRSMHAVTKAGFELKTINFMQNKS